jgi:hypothetical protein
MIVLLEMFPKVNKKKTLDSKLYIDVHGLRMWVVILYEAFKFETTEML